MTAIALFGVGLLGGFLVGRASRRRPSHWTLGELTAQQLDDARARMHVAREAHREGAPAGTRSDPAQEPAAPGGVKMTGGSANTVPRDSRA